MKKIIFNVFAIIILIAGIYGYREYTRKNNDLSHVRADYYYRAASLISEFQSNEKTSNEKFVNRIIAVNGPVKEIMKDDEGQYIITIGGKGNLSAIRCSIDSNFKFLNQPLQLGELITIKGACAGFNSDDLLGADIILNRCVIENK